MSASTPIEMSGVGGPHAGAAIRVAGEPLETADLAVILLHGRGATAADILSLAPHVARPGVAFVAPQAGGRTWYPASFLAPFEVNGDAWTSAHELLGSLHARLSDFDFAPDRIGIAGFSQGACLAVDHVLRNPGPWAFVASMTGGFVGPPGTELPPAAADALAGVPAYLGASDPDPHVPWERVEETAAALAARGADVTLEPYPGMPHAVLPEHVANLAELLRRTAPDS